MKKSLLTLSVLSALAISPLALANHHEEGEMGAKGMEKAETMKGEHMSKDKDMKKDKQKDMKKDKMKGDDHEHMMEGDHEHMKDGDHEHMKEHDREHMDEHHKEMMEGDDAEMEGKGKPDVPPGMAKKDEHPSTGKGSEQGQESRNAEEKPWWNFWN